MISYRSADILERVKNRPFEIVFQFWWQDSYAGNGSPKYLFRVWQEPSTNVDVGKVYAAFLPVGEYMKGHRFDVQYNAEKLNPSDVNFYGAHADFSPMVTNYIHTCIDDFQKEMRMHDFEVHVKDDFTGHSGSNVNGSMYIVIWEVRKSQ